MLLSYWVTKYFVIHWLSFIWKHWNMIWRLSRCNNGWESKYFAFYCSSSFFLYACVFWELFSKATNSKMTRRLSKHVTLDILMWSKPTHLKTRYFFNSFYIYVCKIIFLFCRLYYLECCYSSKNVSFIPLNSTTVSNCRIFCYSCIWV